MSARSHAQQQQRRARFARPFLSVAADADRARKHGMEEFIAADPITFDHNVVLAELQTLSLDWRLKDPFASLVKKNTIVNK